ncbi:MAG: exodeoxyribonuclease VII small subunit [candidate division KSB1 bacterium]|nr:exodeoxyribonuclease VII small subunit [candidate division KSB1 bacterium]MDZ7365741.1 exodeoxyribonuclease VII small subunit [candidate division KSB1 bacterium]MDZ7403779.1 exodeoxyribonuclease VII small subunit [candidate division KSB1 bacterium]
MGKKLTFEAAMNRLEAIVQQLEQGRIGLDEAIKIFEEGMTLYKQCQLQLQEAEKKIEVLMKTDEGFQLELMEVEA